MGDYYDINGKPISFERWAQTREDNRRIASTELPGGVWISTVYMGLDHRFGGEGPPLIFETMVFAPDELDVIVNGPKEARVDMGRDLDMARYATREQAEAGHEAMVTKWTGWTPGDPEPEDEEDESWTSTTS